LTITECHRGVIRAQHVRRISGTAAADLALKLDAAALGWNLLHADRGIFARAGQRFPVEPIRTLDALHLASALFIRQIVGELALVTLDTQVREAAEALGFTVADF
jgi:hypothetical protein